MYAGTRTRPGQGSGTKSMALHRQYRPSLEAPLEADLNIYDSTSAPSEDGGFLRGGGCTGPKSAVRPPVEFDVDDSFVYSFPPSSALTAFVHEHEGFIQRTLRASMPPTPIPSSQMNSPTLHKNRPGSVDTTTTRSSFESRFASQRSATWSSIPSSRSSIDTDASGQSQYTHNTTQRPQIPTRATSWNGQQNGECVPRNTYAVQRPIALMRPQRLAGARTLSVSNVPGEGFVKLPREILMVIFGELRKLHLDIGDGSETCPTCYMRDLCSLALTNQKVSAAAQSKLLEKIWLVGPDSQKRFKKSPSRLKLLRRTLDANPLLSVYVRELKVPDMPEATATKLDQEKYFELVASIITSCPNLERLVGLYPAYNHDFSRLTHALSTRPWLAEHVWNIYPSPHQRSSTSNDHRHSGENRARDSLLPEQAASFLSHHYNWPNLSTLVIHCQPGGNIDPQLISRTFNYIPLPSLTHLALSAIPKLPMDLFDSLPPLQSLHLSNLPSITPQLLLSLSRAPSAPTLTSLHLVHANLSSLPVLTRLLSSLTSLRRLSVIQDDPPMLPIETSIFLHPYLASTSLRHLTWDILHPDTTSVDSTHSRDATHILAAAIRHGGFPSLRVLRCPTDYDGALQELCRPTERIVPPISGLSSGIWKGGPTATLIDMIDVRRKDSGISITASNPSSTSDEGYGGHGSGMGGHSRSLRIARQAAQARIDAARAKAGSWVVVEDWTVPEDVRLTAMFEIAGFVGTSGSKISYELDAEEGKEECGVRVEDLFIGEGGNGNGRMGKGDGSTSTRKHFCDGRWNAWDATGEKARKGWQHKERVKWKPIEVARLFN